MTSEEDIKAVTEEISRVFSSIHDPRLRYWINRRSVQNARIQTEQLLCEIFRRARKKAANKGKKISMVYLFTDAKKMAIKNFEEGFNKLFRTQK